MGALHAGHLELIKQCKSQQSVTIASIFINPTQFNDPADFKKYPVSIEKDIQLLESAGCDMLFLPSVGEIYPDGQQPATHYNLGSLEDLLEGYYRPGHFQGVCQVVHRLLDIIKPGHLYLGRKDYQQCMVIQKMIDQTGLQTTVHMVPTIREQDGLAMSSRNMRLSGTERKAAASIYRQLQMIHSLANKVDPDILQEQAAENLLRDGFSKVDYVSIAHPDTLLPVTGWEKVGKAVILIAAFIGNVRLIDNLVIGD